MPESMERCSTIIPCHSSSEKCNLRSTRLIVVGFLKKGRRKKEEEKRANTFATSRTFNADVVPSFALDMKRSGKGERNQKRKLKVILFEKKFGNIAKNKFTAKQTIVFIFFSLTFPWFTLK
jgi:hypothetical protein